MARRDFIRHCLKSQVQYFTSHDFTGRHFERGEQSRGAVPLVIVALPAERAAIGKLQITCARSTAWIEGFSSTQITMAFSGGAR